MRGERGRKGERRVWREWRRRRRGREHRMRKWSGAAGSWGEERSGGGEWSKQGVYRRRASGGVQEAEDTGELRAAASYRG